VGFAYYYGRIIKPKCLHIKFPEEALGERTVVGAPCAPTVRGAQRHAPQPAGTWAGLVPRALI